MNGLHLETRASVRPHDHAVFVYSDEHELLMPLERFLREGISSRQLTTFVHSHDDANEAHAFLASKISDAPERERSRDLTLAHHRDAFERAGRIDHEHVEGIVRMLDGEARSSGREGLRVFVDASKRYLSTGRSDEWFAFERWLGPHLAAEMGLVCAYEAKHLADPKTLAAVLETHAYRFHVGPSRAADALR